MRRFSSSPLKIRTFGGVWTMLTLTAALFVTSGVASAESPLIPGRSPARHYPLRHDLPPGVSGQWAAMIHRPSPADMTFIRFELPGHANIEVFGSMPTRAIPIPGWCGVGVGRLYRVRISGLSDFPGVELYPTVEIVDRTTPPLGRESEFAVPIRLTTEEIEQAVAGQLLTKVVYVEQPQIASPFPTVEGLVVETLTPKHNLLEEADRRGRPIVILRLGARTPDPNYPDPHFFGPGGPVLVSQQQPMPEPMEPVPGVRATEQPTHLPE